LKFFFISEGGDGAGLALKLQNEGHDVKVWIRDDEAAPRCKGLLKEHSSFSIDEDTIIVADCTGSGDFCDALRDSGYLVLGGSRIADRLEMDRAYAQSTFDKAGISTPNTEYFKDWEEARVYVEAQSERLVFKPEGELSGVVPSYVSYDQEDMLEMLEFFKGQQGKGVPEFAIQHFIEGTCVSSEAWFTGEGFLRPFNHTIERKQLMNGDLGPSGGCTGNLVWACDDDECPLCTATLEKLEEFLRSVNYVGAIDVNAVVGESGIFALEFTPRFGYDAAPTLLCALLDAPLGLFFESCFDAVTTEMPLLVGYATGVRVSVPPWPSEKYPGPVGTPLRGLKDFEHFYPYDVMKVDDALVTCGAYGITGVALGYATAIEASFEQAYRVADKLRLPDKQYRNDLTEVCMKDFRKLNKLLKELA
jgi:phosphoribosylamine---glycine ligase